MRRPLFIALCISAFGVVAVGCSDTVEPADPQIVIAMGTDLRAGQEIDEMEFTVLNSGGVVEGNTYFLTDTFLPATKTLSYGPSTTGGITARVIGKRGGAARVTQEVSFGARPTGLKMYRLSMDYLCVDQPACPAGQTCSAGACVPTAADVTKLEDYSESKIFGGEKKQCFDVDACFSAGVYLNPIQSDKLGGCLAAIPGTTADSMNIGLVHLTGDKTGCPDTGCVTPLLPDSEKGWSLSGSTVTLPEMVCTKVKAGEIRVVRTNLCQKLSVEIPRCGAFSSVTESPIVPSNPPAQKGYVEFK